MGRPSQVALGQPQADTRRGGSGPGGAANPALARGPEAHHQVLLTLKTVLRFTRLTVRPSHRHDSEYLLVMKLPLTRTPTTLHNLDMEAAPDAKNLLSKAVRLLGCGSPGRRSSAAPERRSPMVPRRALAALALALQHTTTNAASCADVCWDDADAVAAWDCVASPEPIQVMELPHRGSDGTSVKVLTSPAGRFGARPRRRRRGAAPGRGARGSCGP